MLTRRRFGATLGAALAVPGLAKASVPTLTAGMTSLRLAPPGYSAADLWCFDGQTPGPEIRLRQGQRLERRFVNALAEPSSVHWHGIRLENAMDGVPGLTQKVVQPGASFDYGFTVPDAGTYWYHSHNRSWEQMARGLYGPLIIDEVEPPDIDQDITLVVDDWRLAADGSLAGDYGNLHDHAHGGRLGNFITVNGRETGVITASPGTRLRLRLINTANARIFDLGWKGLTVWVVALDGMPLETPVPLERLTLAPAQRADLIADVSAQDDPPVIFLNQDGTGYALVDFEVTGRRVAARQAPTPLPPNPVPGLTDADTANAATTTVVMEGGAMGGLSGARHKGEDLDMRTLAQRGLVWALNGVAGMTEVPLIRTGQGALHRIVFDNRTAFAHGMHLHGHHFRQVSASGTLGPWRDTVLVEARSTREIVFVADNPGRWLLHCHMLGHQAAGMKTWMQVAG